MMAQTQKEFLEQYRLRLSEELGKYDRSQSALARHLGINQSAVSRMVSGGRRIRLEEQAQIEAYLQATDPNPPFRPDEKLPSTMATAADPLMAFPELEELVATRRLTREYAQTLAELDDDYPLVMTTAAWLERELNTAVAQLIEQGKEDYETFGYGLRHNLVEKVEAVERAGLLAPSQAAVAIAVLALRDAFAHSPVLLSLSDEPVFAVAERIVRPGYFAAADASHAQPKVMRLQILLSVVSLVHTLITKDPKETASMFLDMAFKTWNEAEPG